MKIFRAFILFLLLAHCFAAESGSAPLPVIRSRVVRTEERMIGLTLALLDEKVFQARVIDNASKGDSPKFANLRDAMLANQAVAGCNGGFFNRAPFDPFGLLICDGKSSGKFDRSSWMAGVIVIRGPKLTLESESEFEPTASVNAALQTGPWLIRNNKAETELDSRQVARRTFIANNGKGFWVIGSSAPATLRELAAALRDASVVEVIDVVSALNLDGGPSTGLWVKSTPTDIYDAEGWPVRDFICFVPLKDVAVSPKR